MRRARIRLALALIAPGLAYAIGAGCGDDGLPRFARPPASTTAPDAGEPADEDAGPAPLEN